MGIWNAIARIFGAAPATTRAAPPVAAGPTRGSWPPPGFEGYTVVESYAAGAKRNERQSTVASLRPRDLLTLVPEPDNPHDRNAIALMTPSGDKLGYVPRDSTAPLHQALLEGGAVRAAVKQVWVRGYEGRGNLAVDIYLGWRLLSVREKSAARATGALSVDLGSGEKMRVRGIRRIDAYYRLLEGIETARKVGRHMDAYSYCIHSIGYLPDLLGVDYFFQDGEFLIRSVPAIEIGSAYAAVLDDEPRLALIESAVTARPEFAPWLADVQQARRMQGLARDLRALLAVEPSFLQSGLPKRLSAAGKDTSKVVKYLEGLGLLLRDPQGKSYALRLVSGEVVIPAWFDQ